MVKVRSKVFDTHDESLRVQNVMWVINAILVVCLFGSISSHLENHQFKCDLPIRSWQMLQVSLTLIVPSL